MQEERGKEVERDRTRNAGRKRIGGREGQDEECRKKEERR